MLSYGFSNLQHIGFTDTKKILRHVGGVVSCGGGIPSKLRTCIFLGADGIPKTILLTLPRCESGVAQAPQGRSGDMATWDLESSRRGVWRCKVFGE